MPPGRPKKPIPIRSSEGDTQKKGANKERAIIAAAHNAKKGRPTRPAGLDAIARGHWDYLADGLLREGLLAVIDEGSLTAAATAYSAMMKAHKAGDHRALDLAQGRYMQLADRLGLHESARAKFTKKADPIDAIEEQMFG